MVERTKPPLAGLCNFIGRHGHLTSTSSTTSRQEGRLLPDPFDLFRKRHKRSELKRGGTTR
jgi:hypothetical protein